MGNISGEQEYSHQTKIHSFLGKSWQDKEICLGIVKLTISKSVEVVEFIPELDVNNK